MPATAVIPQSAALGRMGLPSCSLFPAVHFHPPRPLAAPTPFSFLCLLQRAASSDDRLFPIKRAAGPPFPSPLVPSSPHPSFSAGLGLLRFTSPSFLLLAALAQTFAGVRPGALYQLPPSVSGRLLTARWWLRIPLLPAAASLRCCVLRTERRCEAQRGTRAPSARQAEQRHAAPGRGHGWGAPALGALPGRQPPLPLSQPSFVPRRRCARGAGVPPPSLAIPPGPRGVFRHTWLTGCITCFDMGRGALEAAPGGRSRASG